MIKCTQENFQSFIFPISSIIMFHWRKSRTTLIQLIRYYCLQSSTKNRSDNIHHEVRVRFAPSPTGKMHFGGLRTALYNYIFAKQNEGSFVLRIEDTDKARLVEGSAEDIANILDWFDISPDESPTKGGQYGPYVQSRRVQLYKASAEQLVSEGLAYRCFCSEMRLELLRRHQAKNRQRICYDGKCRTLSMTEVEDKMSENDGQYVIRFALRPGSLTFDDGIFGRNTQDLVGSGEGDFVILKRDGFPTYHLANVVDDHAMNISHVLRGAEWLSSTTKHIQMFRAFDWKIPQYYHFPLLTNPDGSKLSKRQNDMHLQPWQAKSFDSTAILNYLTTLGGGMPKSKQDTLDIWDLDKLIREFDFNRIKTNSTKFSVHRLIQFNASELRTSWRSDPKAFIQRCKDFFSSRNVSVDFEDEYIMRLIENIIDRLTCLDDLLSEDFLYLWRPPELDFSGEKFNFDKIVILNESIRTISGMEWHDQEAVISRLKMVATKNNVNWPHYCKFLRKSLINSKVGQPVMEILLMLGKSRSIQYLESAIHYVQQSEDK